jgi:hypothetical protein
MRLGISLCLFGLLSGCATGPVYNKFGGTQQDFMRSKTDCTVKEHQSGIRSPYVESDFFDDCMAGEGWALRTPAKSSLTVMLEAVKLK